MVIVALFTLNRAAIRSSPTHEKGRKKGKLNDVALFFGVVVGEKSSSSSDSAT